MKYTTRGAEGKGWIGPTQMGGIDIFTFASLSVTAETTPKTRTKANQGRSDSAECSFQASRHITILYVRIQNGNIHGHHFSQRLTAAVDWLSPLRQASVPPRAKPGPQRLSQWLREYREKLPQARAHVSKTSTGASRPPMQQFIV
ncbi:hypothetical protein C8035_v004740 [Colletotrichum spinosum]|uniref:Uncharacterized protein n=2 Tax=Colletotrichum orbiculare species complex TaxID=2707354 RepID=A0A4R8REN6_COLTR|nr:hypothetical protein C8035_v004740 [Colletotrichum spinosum]TDZ58380.1 hypothetical protein CTRI78_v005451 [Colletotrichum trifolii]